jgi:Chain length determinant protein
MDEYAPELRERFRMIWRHKVMIIATASVAALVALVYSLALPKTYEAQSQLVIRPILPQAAFASSGLATAEGGPLGLDVSIARRRWCGAGPWPGGSRDRWESPLLRAY